MAEYIDISSRNLSNIELGLSYPKPETLEKIIKTLNITEQELFTIEHLKSDDELINEIYAYIDTAKINRKNLNRFTKY